MDIQPIDLKFCGSPEVIASYLIRGDGNPVVVETGPGSTLNSLRKGLEGFDLSFEDISDVFVTHIHLDHSGGAWALAEAGALVHVPRPGARHVIDPERLVESARMVYGDRFDELWGDVRGVIEEKVNALEDEQRVEAGGLTFHCWDSHGHAKHHQVFGVGDNAFVGDVVGCRLPGQKFIALTSAPPQFDPEAWSHTLTKLEAQNYRRIYPPHFGPVEDVTDHIRRYRSIVATTSELVRRLVVSQASDDEVRTEFREFARERADRDGLTEEDWQRYESANPSDMCADGVALYWRKKLAE